MEITNALQLVESEYVNAKISFGEFLSEHDGAAIIREEYDEFWEEVKKNKTPEACNEAMQLAAMAIKFITRFGKYDELKEFVYRSEWKCRKAT